jgi:hypothetical protein
MRIREIYEDLLELPVETRVHFLSTKCKDPSLHRKVESLLKNMTHADSYFDRVEKKILELGMESLGKDPSHLNAWLDCQPENQPEGQHKLIGKTVSHFNIIEPIGKGGMGMVYLAHDTKMERKVALKFLPSYLNQEGEIKAQFIHEARAASSLQHPNIATVHEIDETEDHQIFIAMAYYPGETLKERIERGPVDVEAALDFATQLSAALARAHENGIIHRDIKPGNILIGEDGRLRLLDFGLAQFARTSGLSKSEKLSGTIPYMSPEQVRGETADERSDVWSFGIVLCEMLTGKRPFPGTTPQEVFEAILEKTPQCENGRIKFPGRHLKALRQIAGKCLEKEPDKRFASSTELQSALEGIQDQPFRKVIGKRLVMSVIVLLLAGIILGGYDYFMRPRFEATVHFAVVEDPFSEGQGKVLMMHPGTMGEKGQLLLMSLPLSEEARIGATGKRATWYLRIGQPSVDGVPGDVYLSWGLASESNLNHQFTTNNKFSLMGRNNRKGIMAFCDGKRFRKVYPSPLDTDTYYELWYVVDHERNTYDLHVRGGSQFPEITRVAKDAGYRTETSEMLDYLVLITDPGSTAGIPKGKDPGYLDDFYIYPQGERLESPDGEWILLGDFEDGETGEWNVRVDVW